MPVARRGRRQGLVFTRQSRFMTGSHGKEDGMNAVRILVGTRKGAFILTADGARRQWDVSGPHFGGWEIYHVKGSPADPDRLYASQTSNRFGQLLQRSDNGGRTWAAVSNAIAYEGEPGTHRWYDGTPRPWEFKRVWHQHAPRAGYISWRSGQLCRKLYPAPFIRLA
jgi:hypothetical protein